MTAAQSTNSETKIRTNSLDGFEGPYPLSNYTARRDLPAEFFGSKRESQTVEFWPSYDLIAAQSKKSNEKNKNQGKSMKVNKNQIKNPSKSMKSNENQ